MLDAVPPGEKVEVVDAIAAPIPLQVIADLFGVGEANLDLFRRWSDTIIAAADLPDDERDEQRTALETNEMVAFLMEHIELARRRRERRARVCSSGPTSTAVRSTSPRSWASA